MCAHTHASTHAHTTLAWVGTFFTYKSQVCKHYCDRDTEATRVPWPPCLPQISGIWATGHCEQHLPLLLPAFSCSEGYLYALEKVGEADCLANTKLRPWIWSPWVPRPPTESPQSWVQNALSSCSQEPLLALLQGPPPQPSCTQHAKSPLWPSLSIGTQPWLSLTFCSPLVVLPLEPQYDLSPLFPRPTSTPSGTWQHSGFLL